MVVPIWHCCVWRRSSSANHESFGGSCSGSRRNAGTFANKKSCQVLLLWIFRYLQQFRIRHMFHVMLPSIKYNKEANNNNNLQRNEYSVKSQGATRATV